jgi:Kef-type K+ transport system membrane component KefB
MITSILNSSVLILLGVAVFGGIANALLFKRMSIPQVLGYMATGIILGESGFHVIGAADIEQLAPVNLFCLAVIGFLVGSELRFETMKKYGKQFSAILLGEGLGAFFLVGISVVIIVFSITHNISTAVAAGIVFGAIASATDPASTIAVMWEYRTAGILTTTLTAIVALDDALAMSLYGTGSGIAQILAGESVSIIGELGKVGFDLFGSIGIGIVIGFIIAQILKRSKTLDGTTASTIGLLMFLTGITDHFNMDIILAAMAAGLTVANMCPQRADKFVARIRAFAVIIYVLFFVFVGARLKLSAMPSWLWMIVAVYVVGRSVGKVSRAWLCGKISHASIPVVKYCGMGLFAQGGVAVGLSIMAGHHLQNVMIADGLSLGDTIIFGITTTTFFIQLIGPPMVKLAVKKAGEIGRNITEEDVMSSMKVSDVIIREFPSIAASSSLRMVLQTFAHNTFSSLPVLTAHGELAGVIGIDEVRESIIDQEGWDWIIANDILSPTRVTVSANDPVGPVIKNMEIMNIGDMIVIDNEKKVTGMIRMADTRAAVRKQLIERHTTPEQNAAVPTAA